MIKKQKYRVVETTLGSGKKRYYIHVRGWFGIWYEYGADYDIPNWFDSMEQAERCISNWQTPNKIVAEL